MDGIKLYMGSEEHGSGNNVWVLELNVPDRTCRWGYHSRWMGMYDQTVMTDGVIKGRVIGETQAGVYALVFDVCYLEEHEYQELHANTFLVHDQEQRQHAIAKAQSLWKYMEVHLSLDSTRRGIYYEEAHEDGLFPEKSSFVDSMGQFLERTAGQFTAVLTNHDLITEHVHHVEDEGTEDEISYTDVVHSYKNKWCALPFGMHQKHIPLFDVDAELRWEDIQEEYREEFRRKSLYRKMLLTNMALSLLGEKPRYSEEMLQEARSLFRYDTLAEENIAKLQQAGVTVLHGVDATLLHTYRKEN